MAHINVFSYTPFSKELVQAHQMHSSIVRRKNTTQYSFCKSYEMFCSSSTRLSLKWRKYLHFISIVIASVEMNFKYCWKQVWWLFHMYYFRIIKFVLIEKHFRTHLEFSKLIYQHINNKTYFITILALKYRRI